MRQDNNCKDLLSDELRTNCLIPVEEREIIRKWYCCNCDLDIAGISLRT